MATFTRCDRCGQECGKGDPYFNQTERSVTNLRGVMVRYKNEFRVEASVVEDSSARQRVDLCLSCLLVHLDRLRDCVVEVIRSTA